MLQGGKKWGKWGCALRLEEKEEQAGIHQINLYLWPWCRFDHFLPVADPEQGHNPSSLCPLSNLMHWRLLSPGHWESRNSCFSHDTWKVLTARPRRWDFSKVTNLVTSLSCSDWQSTAWKTGMLKALSEKVSKKVKLQTSRVTFKSIAPELSLQSFLI